MFNSITSAISSYFKPKETSTTKPSISPFNNAPTTSVNPFTAPKTSSVSPMQMNKGLSTIASMPSASFSINKPASTAIQNQVLSSPVTVAKLTNPPATLATNTTSPTPTLGTSPVQETTTPTATKGGREDVLSRILTLTEKQGTQADKTLALEKEYELQAKQETLNSLNAKALSVDRDYENKRRAIMENPEGKLTGALAGEIKNLDVQRDQQLADIGIQQAVAQGNVNLVNENIKRRVDAEYSPIKTQIEGLKSYMSLYGDDLTEKEKTMLDGEIKKQEFDYESGVKTAKASQGASAWQQLLDSGQVTIKDIPQALVPYMNVATVKKYTEEQVAPLRQKVTLISDLVKGVDNSGAVGTNPLARTSLTSWATGNRQNFVAGVKQLTSQETLNALLELKAGGGTLGALSEGERFMLQESATKIGGWEIKDKNGIGSGFYNASEKDFKKELLNLQTLAEKAMLKADVVPLAEKAQLIANKISRDNPSWSEDTKREALRIQLEQYKPKESFSSAGNATASTLRNAIVSQESGGSYTATNKDSGALGKYQIMPSNLKNLVGLSDTPENRKKFLNSPQLQDQAFDNLLAELNKTYKGDVKKVLGAYYGGGGGAKVVGTPAGDKPQGKYPSINQYVSQILNRIKTA